MALAPKVKLCVLGFVGKLKTLHSLLIYYVTGFTEMLQSYILPKSPCLDYARTKCREVTL